MATTITPAILKRRTRCIFTKVNKNEVQDAIDEAVRWLNEPNWGASHFDDGVLYLATHLLEELEGLRLAGLGGGTNAVPAGAVESERLLSWSASYAINKAFEDNALATTVWGRKFIAAQQRIMSVRQLPQ